jgi:hypothetical protein
MSVVNASQQHCSRRLIVPALAIVILLGLTSRMTTHNLPVLISKHLGDALWSLMFFLLALLLRPQTPSLIAALFALAIASATEFLKLYHAPWLENLRAHPLGALLLGRNFIPTNFITYAIAVAIALLAAPLLRKSRRLQPTAPRAQPPPGKK